MGTEAFLPGKPSQETSHLSIYHFPKLDSTKYVYGGNGTKMYFPHSRMCLYLSFKHLLSEILLHLKPSVRTGKLEFAPLLMAEYSTIQFITVL